MVKMYVWNNVPICAVRYLIQQTSARYTAANELYNSLLYKMYIQKKVGTICTCGDGISR